jgi:hypothetical protein
MFADLDQFALAAKESTLDGGQSFEHRALRFLDL